MGKAIYFVLSAAILFEGCKKDNPCIGETTTSAAFQMGPEMQNPIDRSMKLFNADTVYTDMYIRFRADNELDSYEWTVGLDDRTFTTKDFTLIFRDPVTINVRLVGRKKAAAECFPLDNGIDSVTKRLVVIQKPEYLLGDSTNFPLLGSYHGYNTDNPLDTFTMSIKYRRANMLSNYNLRVYNFNKGCSYMVDFGNAYRELVIGNGAYSNAGNGCQGVAGTGTLSEDHRTLTIEYTMYKDWPNDKTRVHKTFIGTKK